MKKYLPLVIILCLIKLAVHLIGNPHYGFHRDELLHMSAGMHLAWGYMEFPPFIAFMARIAYELFDVSLWGLRIFPTLAGIGILVLCCAMALEMGGKKMAVILAGVSVLAFLPFYRNHLLFQPVAFDQFFWAAGFWLLLKYCNTQQPKYLVLLGCTVGLGMMNKYTFCIWGLGVAAGLLFYDKGRIYRSKWLYIAAGIAALILLPNIIWNIQHHFPILLHLQRLEDLDTGKASPWAFAVGQLEHPFTLMMSLIGLYGLYRGRYRAIGIAVTVIFISMWALHAKAYYFFAAYPVMFAAGAVKMERWLARRPKWNYAVVAVMVLPVIPFIPDAIPVLPIETYLHYKHKSPRDLTSDYADMFGWEEQVRLVDSVYRTLPQPCAIWAENYGEAGAILMLGKKYGLPEPICRHGSFWLWGPGNDVSDIVVSIGNERPVADMLYRDVQPVRIITHPYAIDEEVNIPVFICRQPKLRFRDIWPEMEKRVFE